MLEGELRFQVPSIPPDIETDSEYSRSLLESEPEDDEEIGERLAWISKSVNRLAVVCGLLGIIHFLPVAIIGPYVVTVFHSSNILIGILFFVFYGVSIVVSITCGYLGPIHGYDKILCWCTVTCALGYCICAVATSFWMFAFGLGIAGTGGVVGIADGQIRLITALEIPSAVRWLMSTLKIAVVYMVIEVVAAPLGGILYTFVSLNSAFFASITLAIPSATFAFYAVFYDYDTFQNQFALNQDVENVADAVFDETSLAVGTESDQFWMWVQVAMLCLLNTLYCGILAVWVVFWALFNLETYDVPILISTVQVGVSGIFHILSVGVNLKSEFCWLPNDVLLMLCFFLQMGLYLFLEFLGSATFGWVFIAVRGLLREWFGPVAVTVLMDVTSQEAVVSAREWFSVCSNIGFCLFPLLYAVSGLSFPEFGVWLSAVAQLVVVCLMVLRFCRTKDAYVPRERS